MGKESEKEWIYNGQNVCSSFSIRCYGKTQTNILANPIYITDSLCCTPETNTTL